MSTLTTPDHAADQFLEHDGARLRWRLAGAGPAVALLHGWALDLDYWDPVVMRLTPRFTVLRFDRSGFGLSAGAADIHRNVDDLAALLHAAGIDRIVLIGMSQGARLAIHFALRYPALSRGLLLDGAPALDAESELPLDEYRRTLETRGPAALQQQVLQHPLMQLAADDATAQMFLAGIVARYRGTDLYQQAPRRQAPELGLINAPALILNGRFDSPARLEAGRGLQAAIPGAQYGQLPNAGHLAALDDPAGYAEVIRRFCDGLPP